MVVFGVVLSQLNLLSAQNPFAEAASVDTLLLSAEDSLSFLVVQDIVVEGNRKTRQPIVLREMSLDVGDTIWLNQYAEILQRQEILLLNTSLFSEVSVLLSNVQLKTNRTAVRVVLQEKWYLYPAVDFDLADRNFNIWWTEQNRALDRINYGLKIKHSNVTGRADKLSIFGQVGYTRKGEIKYEIPYIDKAKVLGLDFGILGDQNREWGVRTSSGRLKFLDLDSINVLQRRRFRAAITIKPGLFLEHELRLERQDNRIDRRLASDENPNFFGAGRARQRFWGLRYMITLDRRDIRPFPINGYLIVGHFEKKGLTQSDDINRLVSSVRASVFKGLGSVFSIAASGKVLTDLERSRVPFFNRESLGFDNDFVRGYQLYVVDGLDYAYLKTTLRAEVLDREFRLPFAPVQRLKRVPTRIYLGVHGDLGGTRDPFFSTGNVLSNQILSSYGVGAYAVFYYSKVIRFELSRNQFGEWGGFLRYSLGF